MAGSCRTREHITVTVAEGCGHTGFSNSSSDRDRGFMEWRWPDNPGATGGIVRGIWMLASITNKAELACSCHPCQLRQKRIADLVAAAAVYKEQVSATATETGTMGCWCGGGLTTLGLQVGISGVLRGQLHLE
jgi:hypothetical protein